VTIKSILENLKDKKIDVYVRGLGEYSRFQGVLKDISEDTISIKSRYNNIVYIPLLEIVTIIEHEAKAKFLKKKLEDVAIVNSSLQA
jgi:hypothetical protein